MFVLKKDAKWIIAGIQKVKMEIRMGLGVNVHLISSCKKLDFVNDQVILIKTFQQHENVMKNFCMQKSIFEVSKQNKDESKYFLRTTYRLEKESNVILDNIELHIQTRLKRVG